MSNSDSNSDSNSKNKTPSETPSVLDIAFTTLTCHVCHKNKAVGIGSVPFIPISVPYCEDCAENNLIPYDLLVMNTACIGGLKLSNKEWKKLVKLSLAVTDKSMATFLSDVDVVCHELADAFSDKTKEPTHDD